MVKGLGSVGWRTFFVQAAKNYRTMLGMGYAFSELPLHKELPPEQRKPLLTESAEFFNTMPYFIPLTIGMTARARQNGMTEDQVRGMKSTVLGPFGALGDAFYWATLKPAAAVLGVLFALLVNPLAGIIVLLAIFNLFHLPLRLCGAYLGYNLFTKVPAMLEKLKPYRIIAFLQLLIGISLGLTAVGMLGNFALAGINIGLAASLALGAALGMGGSLVRMPLWTMWLASAALAIAFSLF
jgi:mannose/fructose/N-acetylgalactosamine-specific phosphotransferase system component IID